MIELKQLDHLGVDVGDLERARHFYCDLLGLEFLKPMGAEDDPEGLLLRCGSRNFALHRNPKAPVRSREIIEDPTGRAHLAFKVSRADFERARAEFPGKGIPTKGPIEWGGHRCLYFLDPDGNLLELVELWRPGLSRLGRLLHP